MVQTNQWLSKGSKSNPDPLFIFIAFAALSIYSTTPLTLRLFTTLKRRSGLYFYSLLTTSWGLCIRQIGLVTQFLAPNCPWVVSLVLAQVGWVMMVTGFSMVLYSRLSVIVMSEKIRRGVLGMVVFNAVVWHSAMVTTTTGIRLLRTTGRFNEIPAWKRIEEPLERCQISFFLTQEFIISTFYVHAAYLYLLSKFAHPKKARRAMSLLLLVQLVVICIDAGMIIIDFMGFLMLKVFIHSFAYAVKLELEFVVLNQLVKLAKMGVGGLSTIEKMRSEKMGEGLQERKLPEVVDIGEMPSRRQFMVGQERDLESLSEVASEETRGGNRMGIHHCS